MVLPAWVPDDETKPAPMPLLIVQSFVNTWEADTGTDLLGELASAHRWLKEAGLVDGVGVEEMDLVALREMREGIRALLVHNGGGPAPDSSELEALRASADGCRLRPMVLGDGNIELHPEGAAGVDAMAGILLIIRDAQANGTWERLKACRNSDCRWAYYDRSHAGRGAWCDMAVCGNRIKNRNLRSRRSASGRSTGP